MNIEKFKRIIVKRAKRLKFDNVYKLIENRPFILAGGALCTQTPNDFDIYPSDGKEFNLNNITNELTTFDKNRVKFITRTKNALTIIVDGQTLQFCTYVKNNIDELIKSFDFAHCQIGVCFNGHGQSPTIDGVKYTEDYLTSQLCGGTFYTGSEYPLSSLFRTIKYTSRGKFNGKEHIDAIMDILMDVVKRKFHDYNDYKDQLDAIDLGLSEYEKAYELYKVFEQNGMVENSKSN